MASRGEKCILVFHKQIHRRPADPDLTEGMLRALDERAARLNISRPAVIKTLLAQALVQGGTPKRRGGKAGW